MARRKQNLVLFFEDNETYNVINSRLVRLYMNRFCIEEGDEIEITDIHHIKNRTFDEYRDCLSKSLLNAEENESSLIDTHFIIGSSMIEDSKMWNYKTKFPSIREGTLIDEIDSFLGAIPGTSGKCSACTILSGSHSLSFYPKSHLRLKYNYEDAEKEYGHLKKFLVVPGDDVVSINDDLEWFRQRLLDDGINHRYLLDEIMDLFYYQKLSENQIDELKKSITKYNNNLPIYKRLPLINAKHSLTEIEPTEKYLEFKCKRLTFYN